MSEQAVLAAVIAGLAGCVLGLIVGVLLVGAGRLTRNSATSGEQVNGDLVTASLSDLSSRVDTLTTSHAAGAAQLGEQLRQVADAGEVLRHQTGRLAQALNHTGFRGRWGEMQLRRIVEVAGLTRGVDFSEQVSIVDDGSTLRPDMVITLCDERQIIIDAKVPLDALLAADSPLSDQVEHIAPDVALAHSKAVGAHIDQLSSKQYWRQFGQTPEFVVMFLPAESLLSLALATDPALLERAFSRNIVLATPTTLLALLRTVALSWRDQDIAENAQAIHRGAQELLDRLLVMSGHLDKLGSALDGATRSYNRFVGSYESRVLVSARRMNDLGLASRTPDAPAVIDLSPRTPSGVAPSTPPSD